MDKAVVWIQGSNGSGKTTQSRLLIEALSDGQAPEQITLPFNYKAGATKEAEAYVRYGDSGLAVLGKMGAAQCSGLDAVYGNLGADGVTKALKAALDDPKVQIIILECVFATISWYRKWLEADLRSRFNLYAFHLELTLWENFRRISQRRAKKAGTNWWEEHLPDTVYKNVGSKNSETRNIWLKLAGKHPSEKQNCNPKADHCFQLKASFPPHVIHKLIIKHLTENL